jgi:hypothetical protein
MLGNMFRYHTVLFAALWLSLDDWAASALSVQLLASGAAPPALLLHRCNNGQLSAGRFEPPLAYARRAPTVIIDITLNGRNSLPSQFLQSDKGKPPQKC